MTNENFKSGARLLRLTLSLGIVLGIGGWIVDAQAAGPRLTVHVNEPFEFQGRVWPAGPLSVMPTRNYNPSSSLDEIWIGGECLGRMLADRLPAPISPDRDVVFFERSASRRLVLVGYALRGTNESYRYRSVAPVVEKYDAQARIVLLR